MPPPDPNAPFVATERLFTTKDGRVVKEDDPDRHQLLAIPGQAIPAARARELGLVDEPVPSPTVAAPQAVPVTPPVEQPVPTPEATEVRAEPVHTREHRKR